MENTLSRGLLMSMKDIGSIAAITQEEVDNFLSTGIHKEAIKYKKRKLTINKKETK